MIHKCIHSDKNNAIKPYTNAQRVQSWNKIVLLFMVLMTTLLSACKTDTKVEPPLPTNTFNADGSINAYVEISAGTNTKYELDKEGDTLKAEQIAGKDRIIDFLPYPGNYGFVVSTMMSKKEGGDGDALDVLILCNARPQATVIKVLPIGVLLLEDGGQKDHKVIAVPFEESERTLNVENFSTFITKYNAAQMIVQEWFLNYKGVGKMRLLGWKDEQFALSEIRKWSHVQE